MNTGMGDEAGVTTRQEALDALDKAVKQYRQDNSMNDIAAISVSFLVMLNPFAMFVLLQPVRRDMEGPHFMAVLLRASISTAIILVLFYLGGDFLFTQILQVEFESFRVFGGIIIFSIAYLYIIKDRKALLQVKKDVNDLALDVSLPFMVGAGTISLSILLRQVVPHLLLGIAIILLVVFVNYVLILGLGYMRLLFRRKPEDFDKLMDAIMRVNIFFFGAIGIDMIITGILRLLN